MRNNVINPAVVWTTARRRRVTLPARQAGHFLCLNGCNWHADGTRRSWGARQPVPGWTSDEHARLVRWVRAERAYWPAAKGAA